MPTALLLQHSGEDVPGQVHLLLLTCVSTLVHPSRLIKRTELAEFEGLLQTHQKAVMSDGCSILEHAVIEHNLLAASKAALTNSHRCSISIFLEKIMETDVVPTPSLVS